MLLLDCGFVGLLCVFFGLFSSVSGGFPVGVFGVFGVFAVGVRRIGVDII